jgi:hypothetical protein
VIRGNAILDLATNLRKASTACSLGAFFFCGLVSLFRMLLLHELVVQAFDLACNEIDKA